MSKVLCFGELLLRLSPDAQGEWINQNSIPAFIGGSELNVARALALWDVPVDYFTALPDNSFSKNIVQFLSAQGIETMHMQYSGNRIGIYYLPQGADLKHAGVIYDRAHSSFSELKKGSIDWDEVLKDVHWFHFSAICPALSQQVADVCEEALKVCAKKNITVSVDLNYRAKLWHYGKKPVDVMPKLVEYCDIVMGNVWSANIMLNAPLDNTRKEHPPGPPALAGQALQRGNGELVEQAFKTSEYIANSFPKCKAVANTFRFDNEYFATLFTNEQLHTSSRYTDLQVIDKAGSGDCFMAGLIYGFQNKKDIKETLEFSTAAAVGALRQKGDSTSHGVQDVQAIISSHGTKQYS